MTITRFIRGNTSRVEFSRKFHIPIRTLEEWDAGRRTPSDYVINLLAFKVYMERIGEMFRFVVFKCADSSKKASFSNDVIIMSTKEILDALGECRKETDPGYYYELRVYTESSFHGNAKKDDYDIIDWKMIDK